VDVQAEMDGARYETLATAGSFRMVAPPAQCGSYTQMRTGAGHSMLRPSGRRMAAKFVLKKGSPGKFRFNLVARPMDK
jgi:hypothetical protein